MNGGVPVAAAFNPLTDLSNMKARKEAERDLPTTPVEPHQQPTQAFNPVTGQFEQIPPANGANSAALQSRAQQRAAAAKAKKRKKIIIGSVIAGVWKVFGYFIAGGILSGFGPALGEIAGNSFQMAVGLIVGFALFTAVRQAYPPLVRLGNLGIKAGE